MTEPRIRKNVRPQNTGIALPDSPEWAVNASTQEIEGHLGRRQSTLQDFDSVAARAAIGRARVALRKGTGPAAENLRALVGELSQRLGPDAEVQVGRVYGQQAGRAERDRVAARARRTRAFTNAFRTARGTPPEQQGQRVLDVLRRSHSEPRLRNALGRIGPAQLEVAIQEGGATPGEARTVRHFLERHVARRFEHAVQRHVLSAVGESRDFLRAASEGSGPAFERALDLLVSPQGQRMMRTMDAMGIDPAEMSRLIDDMGVHPSHRATNIQALRQPLARALGRMASRMEDAHDAVANHFSDRRGSAYADYNVAAAQVASEWGLSDNLFTEPQYGSVVASGIRARAAQTADVRERDEAVASAVRFAASLSGVGAYWGIARGAQAVATGHTRGIQEAALTFANVGDVTAAEQLRAEANFRTYTAVSARVTSMLPSPLDPVLGELPGAGQVVVEEVVDQLVGHGEDVYRRTLEREERDITKVRIDHVGADGP